MKNLFILLSAMLLSSGINAQTYNTNGGTDAGNSGTYNTSNGYKAGDLVTGSYNSFFGANAGKLNTTGNYNAFFGAFSGDKVTTGYANVGIGYQSASQVMSGNSNILIGWSAGNNIVSGSYNVMVGRGAGYTTTGNYGTHVGHDAGYWSTGSGNVFLGYRAGYYETGSDKLYIDNSNVNTPLIYGDFATNKVGINALPNTTHTLTVGGTVYANAVYAPALFVNGFAVPAWNTAGSDISFTTGNISIGTTNSQGYKLAVAGKIISEEVVIKLQSAWPDYVFNRTYDLMSLAQVEHYIAKHNHLPDVPSARVIQQQGLEVAEMNVLLMKKVEELTLHIIALDKRIQELEKNK